MVKGHIFKNDYDFPRYNYNSIEEEYLYNSYRTSYFSESDGVKLRVLPSVLKYVRQYDPKRHSPYTMSREVVDEFMKHSKEEGKQANLEDLSQIDIEQSADKINLVLGEIKGRSHIMENNLSLLYEDLFRVYNWRHCRPYPSNIVADKTWLELNKIELDIRDKIRREVKDSARDLSFQQKDIRESLLEHKMRTKESQAFDYDCEQDVSGGLEEEVNKEENNRNYEKQE